MVDWHRRRRISGALRQTRYSRRRQQAPRIEALEERQLLAAPSEVVWVEDGLPAGAAAYADGGDAWAWSATADPAPFAGDRAVRSGRAGGMHQLYFQNARDTLPVSTGDVLFAQVYLDPAHVPDEVMLQWNDGSWDHRAYWGADRIGWGTPGTESRHYMGPLPASGGWVRLEVPAESVGLEGRVVNGLAFTLHGGQATWDHAGVGPSGATLPPAPSEVVWVEDGLPAGASAYAEGGDAWSWSAAPTPFAGDRAARSGLAGGMHQLYFQNASDTLPVGTGDVLFAQVYLDPANVPDEVMLQWNDGSWEHRAYWGADQIGWGKAGTESRRYMGAVAGLRRLGSP